MSRFFVALATFALLACTTGTEPTTLDRSPVGMSVAPSELSLVIGDEGHASARLFDSNGLEVFRSIEWTSADPTIATVGKNTGVIKAISAGITTVTATAGAVSASAAVSVLPLPPPIGVGITTAAVNLFAGSVEQLTARAWDFRGRTTPDAIEWSTADPSIATVGQSDGIVTAIRPGTTTVIATAASLRATATVSVFAAPSGSFAFARVSASSQGMASDVLTSSFTDRTVHSLPRAGSNADFKWIGAPSMSANGLRMAVEVIHDYAQEDHSRDYTSDIYVLDPTAPANSPWRAVTTNRFSKSPSVSPDGTRIAYLQQPALFAKSDIYVTGTDGGPAVRLTTSSGWHSAPRWSPDGARLAFSRWSDDEKISVIFLVNADGSGLTKLASNSALGGFDPSWAPDGKQLVFVSDGGLGPEYPSEVYVVDVDGSNLRRIAGVGEFASAPAWSPDGRHILFATGKGIYVVSADGSAVLRVTTPPTPPPSSVWDSAPVWTR